MILWMKTKIGGKISKVENIVLISDLKGRLVKKKYCIAKICKKQIWEWGHCGVLSLRIAVKQCLIKIWAMLWVLGKRAPS